MKTVSGKPTGGNSRRYSSSARVMMIVLALGLGILTFAFTRSLFGPRAAVIAVALYTLEPTVLGHGRIVHTDLPGAFAFLFFFFVRADLLASEDDAECFAGWGWRAGWRCSQSSR